MAKLRYAIVLASVALAVGACSGGTAEPEPPQSASPTGEVSSGPAGSSGPTGSADATASPTPFPSPFPVDAFADISDDPVDAALAATLQQILDDGAAGRGTTATLLTTAGSWTGTNGTADGERALTPEDIFPIASVTKPIIAAQIMMLVEDGVLALDDPASEHLPPDIALDTNGATIRHLLAMQSGLPDYVGLFLNLTSTDHTRAWTPVEALQYVQGSRFTAGEEWEYSDTNYVLLGMVIEEVTGRSVADVLREGALRDPGLARIVIQPAERPTDPIAAPADLVESRGGFLPSLAVASGMGTAGGFAADAPSLAHWWRLFCSGDVVPDEALTLMSTVSEGSEGYGFGLGTDGVSVGHSGGLPGVFTVAACFPADSAVVVVLSKNGDVDVFGIAQSLVAEARS